MSTLPFAVFYPGFVTRLSSLERALRAAPRILVQVRWVRDMAADVLDPSKGTPVDPLWVGGYRRRHSRYVRKDAFPAFHVSDGVTTASAEAFGIQPNATPVLGVPATSRLQLVVNVDVPEVLDLTTAAVRKRLRVSRAAIVQIPDWTKLDAWLRPQAYELTQAIGEIAHHVGYVGIKYPAARATAGVNVVVFTDELTRSGGSITTTNPFTGSAHRLP